MSYINFNNCQQGFGRGNAQCGICHEMITGPSIRHSSCRNTFCATCIRSWVDHNRGGITTCPFCRGTIAETAYHQPSNVATNIYGQLLRVHHSTTTHNGDVYTRGFGQIPGIDYAAPTSTSRRGRRDSRSQHRSVFSHLTVPADTSSRHPSERRSRSPPRDRSFMPNRNIWDDNAAVQRQIQQIQQAQWAVDREAYSSVPRHGARRQMRTFDFVDDSDDELFL